MKFYLSDFKRFESQIILKKIGVSGQKKIQNSKVLIIGMGGLGCPLVTYLASAGVCNIGIVDYDKVELGNLNRQTLFNFSDLGKYKVFQAKKKIKKIYKKIKVKTYKTSISSKNIEKILKKIDGNPLDPEKIEKEKKVAENEETKEETAPSKKN